MIDRLFRNLIAILLLLCAGCVLSLAYWNQNQTEPSYYSIQQEGTELCLTLINHE